MSCRVRATKDELAETLRFSDRGGVITGWHCSAASGAASTRTPHAALASPPPLHARLLARRANSRDRRH